MPRSNRSRPDRDPEPAARRKRDGMDSTVNAIANGNGGGIGQRLIGLQPPLSPPPPAAAAASAPRPAPAAAPAMAPAPVPVATAAPQPAPAARTPSTENLLVRFGLLSTKQ